jgi:hypothetical protein
MKSLRSQIKDIQEEMDREVVSLCCSPLGSVNYERGQQLNMWNNKLRLALRSSKRPTEIV